MTTIKSMYGKDLDIWPDPDFPGWVGIRCKDYWSRLYKMADLANALGLEPKRVHPRASGPTMVESHIEKLRAELKETRAELDEANATIARVREATAIWGDSQFRAAVLAALDPKPEFVLPTEAGAVIEYTDHDGTGQRWFRTRDTQRPWVDREGNTWHDAGVERDIAGDFKILIGAES